MGRGTERRLTTDGTAKFAPVWSPKGDRIAFASTHAPSYAGRTLDLYQRAAGGTGQDELLLANGNSKVPSQWTRDGRFLVFSENHPKTKYDIWVMQMNPGVERKPQVFLHSEFNELHGQLSPDNHWMAYTSDKTGRREVYVVSFPAGEGETRISTDGGEQPRWRGDGTELFYLGEDGKMVAVAVKTGAPTGPGNRRSFEPGSTEPLFQAYTPVYGRSAVHEYGVTADGRRFLVDAEGGGSASVPQLTVVSNWGAGQKK
jgi:Tol biopolymer transport system component